MFASHDATSGDRGQNVDDEFGNRVSAPPREVSIECDAEFITSDPTQCRNAQSVVICFPSQKCIFALSEIASNDTISDIMSDNSSTRHHQAS